MSTPCLLSESHFGILGIASVEVCTVIKEASPTQLDKVLTTIGYIITRNEEKAIDRAVRSLLRVADAVLVVDSCSTDKTVARAEAAGADVVAHPFEGFASQRTWAVGHLSERYGLPEWILTIDADEWLSDALVDELVTGVKTGSYNEVDVLLFFRQVYFSGGLLRHGPTRRTLLPRMFRPGTGDYGLRQINEHFVMRKGLTIRRVGSPFFHADVNDWHGYIEKQNGYSTLEAAERRNGSDAVAVSLRAACRQPHLRRRWLRQNVWPNVPLKPLVRFVHSYLLSGGFLDGKAGLNKAVFASWHEMCIDLKSTEDDDDSRIH